jgi:hypothetical protein
MVVRRSSFPQRAGALAFFLGVAASACGPSYYPQRPSAPVQLHPAGAETAAISTFNPITDNFDNKSDTQQIANFSDLSGH